MMASYKDIVRFIANHLKCPICFEIFTEPVTLACGHSYCLRCIKDYFKQNSKRVCPECRAELKTDYKLHKNVTIRAILELQQAGGREMWDRVLAGSEEEFTQDGSCLIRNSSRTYQSSSSSAAEGSSSSLDCEEGHQDAAKNDSSLPSVPQNDEVIINSQSVSEENKGSVSKDPDSLRGFSDDGTSAAAGLSAEFVSLSFLPQKGHRRLVFYSQRIEVRSSMTLRNHSDRFEACQWMAEQEFTTGRFYWDVETSACSGWAAGVAYTHLGKDEQLGRSKSSWCIEWSSSRFSAWHNGSETPLKHRHPSRLRVLLDRDAGHLSFRSGEDGEAELYDVQVEFEAAVSPVFWLFGTKPGNALSFPRP
ncbi:hypothetical protein KOW79_010456 [Hemibagrus wyckioides]|uniref:Uncharacterized protein n=2 Tax=Hemibagrus wyckioides TaxID=337641 RepID=A0A9D3NRA2_9TELE|nr:hypothetical protein KOW79_010456 [Hemibagrus wyckioides]